MCAASSAHRMAQHRQKGKAIFAIRRYICANRVPYQRMIFPLLFEICMKNENRRRSLCVLYSAHRRTCGSVNNGTYVLDCSPYCIIPIIIIRHSAFINNPLSRFTAHTHTLSIEQVAYIHWLVDSGAHTGYPE